MMILNLHRRAQKPAERLRIGGEYLTIADVAKRLKLTVSIVKNRLSKLRSASGAITLERIAAMGK